MKRAHLLFLLLSTFTSLLHAQDPKPFRRSEISLGPEYAIPTGDFRESNRNFDATSVRYNYGIGGSAKYLFRINNTYGASLQAGAIRYHSKASPLTTSDKSLSFTAIPVKLGANFRYRSLFAEPQLGLTYLTNNNSIYQNASTTYGLTAGSYIGNHIVLSGNYERWNKGGFGASHVGVRLAYAFSTGKLAVVDSIMKERVHRAYALRPQYDKTSEYWEKQKTFKTLGWVSIGVGVPVTLLGLVTAIASTESESIRPSTYQWLLGSGGVVTTSSIPFFILSHKNKKKARI